MADKETSETEPFTAWHPMLVALLEQYLPAGWKLLAEYLLSRLPQRVDIVVLRLEGAVSGPVRKLHSVFDHLRPHTLIEHKGPTDDLAAWDVLTLLAYAGQYMRRNKITDPDALCLMVICDHVPQSFVDQVEKMGGSFSELPGGLWQGRMAGIPLRGVETRDACRTSPSEHLLYAFTRAYVQAPLGLLPLDAEEQRVYTLLYQQVEQFKKHRGSMAMSDIETMEKNYEEVLAEILQNVPARLLVRRLKPEERLVGLKPEERLVGLKPEERLVGLTPDQIIAALPPEAREEIARKLRH